MSRTTGPTTATLQAGALTMRVATQGVGPLVLLCHGFPELGCSWRSQLAALAAAGYRAVAPDLRGYGGTDAPADPAQYTMLHIVGDLVALVQALGEKQAVVVGHDWGAPAAWHAALLRPDVFRAVVGMSVPYTPPAALALLDALERQGITTFYMQHFQTPGVAEAELQADVAASLRRITYSLSGDGRGGVATVLPPGKGLLQLTDDPPQMPAWVDADDLAFTVGEFQRTGFTGGLNWYRALRFGPALLAPWHGAAIHQPSLFIAGDRDDVMKFPASIAAVRRFEHSLPGLRGSHILAGAGHWVQRERAAEVNELLLGFLRGL